MERNLDHPMPDARHNQPSAADNLVHDYKAYPSGDFLGKLKASRIRMERCTYINISFYSDELDTPFSRVNHGSWN